MDELNESTPRAGATGGEGHEISPDANRSPGSPSDAADLTENELEDVVGGVVAVSMSGGNSSISSPAGMMNRAPIGAKRAGGG